MSEVQVAFQRNRGTRDRIANTFAKTSVWITANCGKFLNRWSTRPAYLPSEKPACRIRSNKSDRTGHRTNDWFQVGKGVHQGCIMSPCSFNLYAEYIMRNAGLEEAQLESRLLGEISITSDMQMTPALQQKVKMN